ncbi:MAG TPA: glycoside hydrolase domain-containing protein [Pyrinomonadaceae bacterium]|nr:glycoside hydrolase domain-containing protein [Pyrinomonadaceae bacterium]
MPIFLGFDRSGYPGDNIMQRLRIEARIDFTGFYLAPAPSHGDTGWMSKRTFLQGLGFGFAPVYVGQQQSPPGSLNLTSAQGHIDGANAAGLSRQADFPAGSVIYLDVETGPPVHQPFIDYYKAWLQAVVDNGFKPGVYCSHHLAAQFIGADNRAAVWVFQLAQMGGNFTPPLPRPDPSHSSFAGAKVLQYAQNAKLKLSGRTLNPVDLNTALTADPSTA